MLVLVVAMIVAALSVWAGELDRLEFGWRATPAEGSSRSRQTAGSPAFCAEVPSQPMKLKAPCSCMRGMSPIHGSSGEYRALVVMTTRLTQGGGTAGVNTAWVAAT